MLSWPEGLVGGNTAYQTQMIQVSNSLWHLTAGY